MKRMLIIVVVLQCFGCTSPSTITLKDADQKDSHGPPMGWNSWDSFGFLLSEDSLLKAVDYVAENLKEYGYEYIVIDAGWYYPSSFHNDHGAENHNPPQSIDPYGRLVPDTIKFPSSKGGKGLAPIGEYIHSKGLKFGIHIMRGIPWNSYKQNTPVLGTDFTAQQITDTNDTCEWNHSMYGVDADHEGALAYYKSLIALYEEWGVDFIKVDDIARPYHSEEIELISKAIRGANRPIHLSLSPGAAPVDRADHLEKFANQWRISNDVWDHWRLVKRQFDYCRKWYPFIKQGHWPDADMLPIGKLRLTGGDAWVASLISAEHEEIRDEYSRLLPHEQMTVMNLWSIFRSPLFLGGYPPHNDSLTTALITNRELIELNQASTRNREVSFKDSVSTWTASVDHLERKYIAIFNISEEEKTVAIPGSLLDMDGAFEIRDIWSKEPLTNTGTNLLIEPHGSRLFYVDKKAASSIKAQLIH